MAAGFATSPCHLFLSEGRIGCKYSSNMYCGIFFTAGHVVTSLFLYSSSMKALKFLQSKVGMNSI